MTEPRGLVVAGVHSGVGKTTVSLALMAALRRRGLTVQAFKVGPDFIDPGHHYQVTGRPAHNLDGWMLEREENLRLYRRYASSTEAVIVEGVMGLYDGSDGLTETGSTAQMAKWLGLPVLLCVDARSMARGLAALAQGYARFDPGLAWAGLIANRAGGPRHIGLLSQAMTLVPELTFRGGLVRDREISLPERHLGLVTAEETLWTDAAMNRLADWLESGLDLDALWADLPPLSPVTRETSLEPENDRRPLTGPGRVRLGLAYDQAFCFYYRENLRRLEEAGADLILFSPLHDTDLPRDLAGLYIGGGYPEVFASTLAGNESLRRAIGEFGRAGGPIYAECGGLMYLSRSLQDLAGRVWPMTGLLPLEVRMLPRLKSLGYRRTTLTKDTIIGPAGLTARGHEFHYSEIVRTEIDARGYVARSPVPAGEEAVGFIRGNTLAGYVHLHFGSNPDLAHYFVDSCRAFAGLMIEPGRPEVKPDAGSYRPGSTGT
ncbi:MAG: cobyrinate a,c-diamide synthase [Thermodesulfobacteriota bacterium]